MSKTKIQILAFFLLTIMGFAQPYADLAGFTYQHFTSTYKNNPDVKNHTGDYLLHLLYPKELENGNVFLLKINGELLRSRMDGGQDYTAQAASAALSVGFQWLSKNKKWKTTVMAIPKVASDFEGKLSSGDFQYGGLVLEQYSFGQNLKLKAGLYYNREAFGNFFVPVFGLDYRATDRIHCYGILPSNYKIEYNAVKEKFYTGLEFKWLTRSFNLSGSHPGNYMRFDEIYLKGFADWFMGKNVLLSAGAGYSFGKSPLQYDTATDEAAEANGIYSPLKNCLVFNIGILYRIRSDSAR